MPQHNAEPVEPHVFIEQTHEELAQLLRQHGPLWGTKFKNLIELKEGAAFRYGFYVGAFMSALIVMVFFLITRF